mmetsp:Transcript_38680/g.81058  ORF Transcript_38680/g.81058 Transcript_38680/m.81058 type:complete len:460 (+) Transcript_38680:210-1589(+)
MDQLKHSHNSGIRGEGKNRYVNSHASLSLPSLIETSVTSSSSSSESECSSIIASLVDGDYDGSILTTTFVDDAINDRSMSILSRVKNMKTTETKQDCCKSQFSASSKGIPKSPSVVRRNDNREQLERLVGKVSIISLSSEDKLSETLAIAERLDAMCSSINESYAREAPLEHNNDSSVYNEVHRSREAGIDQDGVHVPPRCSNKLDQATSSRERNHEGMERRNGRNLSRGETNVLYRKHVMDFKQQQHGEQDQKYPSQSESAADYFDCSYRRRSRQEKEPPSSYRKEGNIFHRDSRSWESEPVIRKQTMDSKQQQQQHRKHDQKYLSQSESAANCFDYSHRGRSRQAEEPLGRHVKEIHTHHHDSLSWKSESVMARRPCPTSTPPVQQNYGAKWRKSGQQFKSEGGEYHDRLGPKGDCSESGYPKRQQNTFPRNDGMGPSRSGMRHTNGKYQPMRSSIR